MRKNMSMSKNMRKKAVVWALTGVMALAFVGCGSSSAGAVGDAGKEIAGTSDNVKAEKINTIVPSTDKKEAAVVEKEAVTEAEESGVRTDEEQLCGGWSSEVSSNITDAHKELFKKAQETLAGATFTPIAFLGSQVVAGTNYRFLCRMDASVAELNAKPVYAVVVIYEDLSGNATISEIKASEVEIPETEAEMVGAYEQTADFSMTEESSKAMKLATATLTGAEYKAVALLGSQVVAGTNYRILCEVNHMTETTETGWAILTVYADLEGNAEVTEIAEMN